VFDRLDILNRLWPFIFIRWGGLAFKKSFYRSKSIKILSQTHRLDRSVVPDQLHLPQPVRPPQDTGLLEYLDRLDVDRMGKLTLLKGKTLPVVSATCMARRRRGAQRWRRWFGGADPHGTPES